MAGQFITFEGIDGAGKSIHIKFLADFLRKRGRTVITTREPGGTHLGEKLRILLLHKAMHVETETLLIFAARREHLAKIIEPALTRGDWVISDRFTDSTFAYQGGGRNLSFNKLKVLEKWVHPSLQPNLTLLLDLPVKTARARLNKKSITLDRFEIEKTNFFTAIRTTYLSRQKKFPQRFHILDSTLSIIDVQKQIIKIISNM